MNTLMHYIWANRILPKEKLSTTEGESIKVISTGKCADKESIFYDARLIIGSKEWSGNVVLHEKSSDWEKELRRNSKAYNNVILHVTHIDDIETMRRHGEFIHQLKIDYSDDIAREYNEAANSTHLQCAEAISSMQEIKLHGYLSRLLVERIEEKAKRIEALHKECQQRWDDTLFKLLARNFGFGIQSRVFEEWAATLNMQALGKHRDNTLQIEAIFFGQAGLLDEKSIPSYYLKEAKESKYYNELTREYKFLATKFKLKSLDYKIWGGGNATPHLRIARLAKLYASGTLSLSSIAECNTISELRNLLRAQPDGYWRYHLQFGGTETTGAAPLKNSHTDLLIINTIAPLLYTYGKHRKEERMCSKAEDFLYSLNSEENSIIRRWAQKGVTVSCAADTQALIQLQKEYCNKQRCSDCHFAYEYLKEKIGA